MKVYAEEGCAYIRMKYTGKTLGHGHREVIETGYAEGTKQRGRMIHAPAIRVALPNLCYLAASPGNA
jgi:hypothetical protein